MNGPLEHLAMWNMSDRYEIYQVLYDLFYVWNLKEKTPSSYKEQLDSCQKAGCVVGRNDERGQR